MASERSGRISLIAAIGRNRELGKDNQLLWRIPADLKHFKELTDGHPVIMGRKTWESLPDRARPLPGRTNIVLSRQEEYVAPDALVAATLEDAVAHAQRARGSEEIFIIGGAQLYEAALPLADRLYLTLIDADAAADAYFPDYDNSFASVGPPESGNENGTAYRWQTFERKSNFSQ